MLVKTILSASDLADEFVACNRDYYSYEGYQALIDLFEETDCGQPTELDVIAICCDFNENTAEEIRNDYSGLFNEWAENNGYNLDKMDESEKNEIVGDFLNYYTWSSETTADSYIYQAF